MTNFTKQCLPSDCPILPACAITTELFVGVLIPMVLITNLITAMVILCFKRRQNTGNSCDTPEFVQSQKRPQASLEGIENKESFEPECHQQIYEKPERSSFRCHNKENSGLPIEDENERIYDNVRDKSPTLTEKKNPNFPSVAEKERIYDEVVVSISTLTEKKSSNLLTDYANERIYDDVSEESPPLTTEKNSSLPSEAEKERIYDTAEGISPSLSKKRQHLRRTDEGYIVMIKTEDALSTQSKEKLKTPLFVEEDGLISNKESWPSPPKETFSNEIILPAKEDGSA